MRFSKIPNYITGGSFMEKLRFFHEKFLVAPCPGINFTWYRHDLLKNNQRILDILSSFADILALARGRFPKIRFKTANLVLNSKIDAF